MIVKKFENKETHITDSFGRLLHDGDSFLLIRTRFKENFSDILICKKVGLTLSNNIKYRILSVLKNGSVTEYKEVHKIYNVDIMAESVLLIKQNSEDFCHLCR